jgi:hypothetical protein
MIGASAGRSVLPTERLESTDSKAAEEEEYCLTLQREGFEDLCSVGRGSGPRPLAFVAEAEDSIVVQARLDRRE